VASFFSGFHLLEPGSALQWVDETFRNLVNRMSPWLAELMGQLAACCSEESAAELVGTALILFFAFVDFNWSVGN